MGNPERIFSTFLSLYGRVGVEARGLHWDEKRDRWFEERGVSSSDSEGTVCLSRSDPSVLSVLRVKITKPNIVGIYLYTVFMSGVFLCTGVFSMWL